MKRAYLSISYHNRIQSENIVASIDAFCKAVNIHLFVFVDNYHFTAAEEKQMMQQAFADIRASDFLIAEVSEKAIGVGIEIGYAAALQKPVIYLRKTEAEHSTTAAGASGYTILYKNTNDLVQQLNRLLISFSTISTKLQ